MAKFIPPINGIFRPSSADIASWLYQIWQYLQDNPIANEQELTEIINQTMPDAVAAYFEEHPIPIDYPVDSVNGRTGNVVISYAELVDGLTLPIYRAANDEFGPNDLLEAYNEGCRFAVQDDSLFFVMLKNNNAITLLPITGGGGGGGSGDGIQTINTNIHPDANGNVILSAGNLPMSSSDTTTIKTAIESLSPGPSMTAIVDTIYPVGSIYISVANTSPSTLFPGTVWEQISDKFLLAAGSTYSAGTSGGEATHTLSIAEMPSHSHPLTRDNNSYEMIVAWAGSGGNKSVGTGSNVIGGYIGNTGGGQAHNNMPPYLAVYMWKRTD